MASPAPGAAVAAAVAPKLGLRMDQMRWFLFILIVLTISRIHQQYAFMAKVRPALLLTFGVGIYAYLNPRLLAKDQPLKVWPARIFLALGVLACLSVPFGISMGNSGKFFIEVYSKTLILGFLILVGIRTARDLYAMFWAYVVGAGLLSYLSLFVFKLERYGTNFSYQRLAGLLAWDSNDVGCVLMTGLACALLVMHVASWRGKIVAAVVLAGIGGTISRSGSRGGLIGLVVFGIALVLLARGVSVMLRGAVIGIATVALFSFAPPGYWQQMSTILNPKEDYNWNSKDGRKELAKRGMGYMMAYPFFGIGLNNFSKAECTISDKAKTTKLGTGLRCTPPHNSFVQAGAELGVGGLVLWSLMLVGGLASLARARNRMPRSWRTGDPEQRVLFYATSYLSVAIVGFAATAYFLSFAWLEPYYILGAFIGATLLCINRKLGDADGVGAGRLVTGPVAPAAPAPTRGTPEWRTARNITAPFAR